jgi:hypothetical protein
MEGVFFLPLTSFVLFSGRYWVPHPCSSLCSMAVFSLPCTGYHRLGNFFFFSSLAYRLLILFFIFSLRVSVSFSSPTSQVTGSDRCSAYLLQVPQAFLLQPSLIKIIIISAAQRIPYCICPTCIHHIGCRFSIDGLVAICTWIWCSFPSWHVFYRT